MHDPNKNKVLCVVATGFKWLCWATGCVFGLCMFAVIALVAHDSWGGWGLFIKGAGKVAAGVIVILGLIALYAWSYDYSKKC